MNKIILNMIVKNESKIIERCLDSLIPHIDGWVIVDTGSTDNTKELIKEKLKNIPGDLFESEWVSFGYNRTEAIGLIRKESQFKDDGNIWALLCDADMLFYVQDPNWKTSLTHDSYKIKQQAGTLSYDNVRLVNLKYEWVYRNSTHEYIEANTHSPVSVGKLYSCFYIDYADGGNRFEKITRDIQLLTTEIEEYKNTNQLHRLDRPTFYLAQTLKDAGRFEEAIQLYQDRIKLGGWDEEVWYSYYMISRCYLELKQFPNFISAVWDAYNFRPSRAEPLYYLANYHKDKSQNETAMAICEIADKIKYPAESLFVEDDVYLYRFKEIKSICGFYSKFQDRKKEGYKNCMFLTTSKTFPNMEQARFNSTFYVKNAESVFSGASFIKVDVPIDDGYYPMNPSIWIQDDEIKLNLRTVNYVIGPDGSYIYDGYVRTRNFIVEYDLDFNVKHSNRILDFTDQTIKGKGTIIGYEDNRLFNVNGTYYISSTVLEYNDEHKREMAISKLDQNFDIVETHLIQDVNHDQNQKNWMPFIKNNELYFLYSVDPTIVVEHNLNTHKSNIIKTNDVDKFDLKNQRGSSHVVYLEEYNSYICITHEVYWKPHRIYLHRFILLNDNLQVINVSDPFYFRERNIEFCCGMARHKNRNTFSDTLYLSFGVRDNEAWIMKVLIGSVMQFIRDK